jgi:energy-coupling factor transporter ATP-binding protein EcfA2
LLADEPTTALDLTIQDQILSLLAELQEDLGMAIVLVSHDRDVLAQYADRTLTIEHARVVETGRTPDRRAIQIGEAADDGAADDGRVAQAEDAPDGRTVEAGDTPEDERMVNVGA